MTDARTMSAIAARVVDFMETEFPDHDPLVLRGSLMSAGDVFLQKASMDHVVNQIYRERKK